MKHLEHFSGFKPAVEDMHYERDAKELHIKKRIIDLTGGGSGVLKDVLNEMLVYVADPAQFLVAKVKTGGAYIQGEKIEIGTEQTVTLDTVESEANVVYLKYKLGDSPDGQAFRQQPLIGLAYNVWKTDSFELLAVKESLYVEADDKLKLARVAKVGGNLTVTHDYRTYLQISGGVTPGYTAEQEFYIGGPAGTGKKALKQQSAPPMPTRLRLSTDWDPRQSEIGGFGLVAPRLAYIKAKIGDTGTGTASGNTFTKSSSDLTWAVNEWINQYLTDQNGNEWKVLSNTDTVLTLEATAAPVSGNFSLGPAAEGYLFVIRKVNVSAATIGVSEQIVSHQASPVPMEHTWLSLFPDVKYYVKVCSLGGWYQEERSAFTSEANVIAGGPKEIPDVCADAIENVTITAIDGGLKVKFDIKAAYQTKVAGVEIVYTTNGDAPDFTSRGQPRLISDKTDLFVPAPYGLGDGANPKVKAKLRLVDIAGRHCVTPYSLTDTSTKTYPRDLSDIVADYDNVLGVGGFNNLKTLLEKSLDLSTGAQKWLGEVEAAVVAGAGDKGSIDARFNALSLQKYDFAFTRYVAKSGALYQTVQAALDSLAVAGVPDGDYYILIAPGAYSEDIVMPDIGSGKKVYFCGLGAWRGMPVRLVGAFTDNYGRTKGFANLMAMNSAASHVITCAEGNTGYDPIVFRDVTVYCNNGGAYSCIRLSNDGPCGLLLFRTRLVSDGTGPLVYVAGGTGGPSYVAAVSSHARSATAADGITLAGTAPSYAVQLLWSSFKVTTNVLVAGAITTSLYLVHCYYSVDSFSGTNLTIYSGTLVRTSNVVDSNFNGLFSEWT